MKRIICIFMVMVMILSVFPVAYANENSNSKMKVKIQGERMYVRTNHSDEYDLVQTFRVNGDGKDSSGNYQNEHFDMYEAGLVGKNNTSYTSLEKKLSQGGDDIAPFKTNSSYIGANHGQSNAILVTAENHGKTYADIGSRWKAANYYWNILNVPNENQLLIISDNSAKTDGKYVFEGAHRLPKGTVMTYVSHGENTADITIKSTTGAQQVEHSDKKISVEMYAYIDGEKVPFNEANNLECDYIEVAEHYIVMNPALVAEGLRENRPEGGYTEPQNFDVGKPMIDYKVTYKIMSDGTVLSVYDHTFLDDISFQFYGGYQYITKSNGFGGSVKRYIPKLKDFTINDKYYNFTEPYNLTADNSFLGGGERNATSELWENPDSMPDRSIEYFYDVNNDLKASFSAGYLPILDAEPSVRREKTSNAIYIYKTKKSYPILVNNLAYKNTGTNNQRINAVSYTKYNNVTDEDISYYTIDYENDTYVYIDCHEIAKKDIKFSELGILGNDISLLEKSNNVSYVLDANSVNVNMVDGTYGYLVLRANNDNCIKISKTSDCESYKDANKTGDDISFTLGSSAVYNLGSSIESGTYMVKVNTRGAENTENFTLSATDGVNSWEDTKSSGDTFIIGSFNFTNDKDNKVTIECTSGNRDITLNDIIFEKINDIEILSDTETVIPAMKYANRTYDKENYDWTNEEITGDFTTWNHGMATITSGNYGIYNIDISTEQKYDVSCITSGDGGSVNLYIDGKKVSSEAKLPNGGENCVKRTKVYVGDLSAGRHELKIEAASGQFNLQGLALKKTLSKSLNKKEKTEFSFYNDALMGKQKWSEASGDTVAQVFQSGLEYDKNGSGYIVLDNPEEKASYFVNVEESGIYNLSFIGGRTDASYLITVDDVEYKGELNNASKPSLGADNINHEVYSDFVSGLYLEKGEHEIEIKSESGSAYLYAFIIEAETESRNLSSTNDNLIFAVTDYNNAVFENNLEVYPEGSSSVTGAFAEYKDEGYVVLRNGHKFYYLVNSESQKEYSLSSITGGINAPNVIIKDVYNDKVLFDGSFGNSTTGNFDTIKTKVGTVVLNEGETLLEIESTGNTAHLYGMILSPIQYKKVDSNNTTEFSVYNDALSGEKKFAYGDKLTTAKAFEEGLVMDKEGSGYGVFNGAGHYASYKFEVTEADYYDIAIATGRGNINFDIAIDDKIYSGKVTASTKPSLGTDSQHFEVYKSSMCNIYLEKGLHKITLTRTSGAAYLYALFIEKNIRQVDIKKESLIFAATHNCDATYNGVYEVNTSGNSSVSGDFAVYKDKGFVTFRKGHKFRYELETKRAGYYKLSVIMGGASASSGEIRNYNTNEILYSGPFGASTSGYYNAKKNERGEIFLDKGRTLIEITSTSNTQYFYGFTLKCVIPKVEMKDSDNNEISNVKDGTIKFKSEIGKLPYDDVYFAIYEQKNGINKLYKIAKATVVDGVAETVITDVQTKTGYTYSAKAFMWDESKLFGYSVDV